MEKSGSISRSGVAGGGKEALRLVEAIFNLEDAGLVPLSSRSINAGTGDLGRVGDIGFREGL